MNRKNKIIVSVVGITIVLLALLGLTYGYYLTRIQGNTNINSISVSSADLSLIYTDGDGDGDGKVDGLVAATNIMPGTTLTPKIFNVTNNGTSVVTYNVIIENVNNTFKRASDWTYILQRDGEEEPVATGIIKITDTQVLLEGVIIEPNKTHTYKLIITYTEPNEDQSIDMGKNLSFKVNINNIENPFTVKNVYDDSLYVMGLQAENTEPQRTIMKDKNTTNVRSIVYPLEKGKAYEIRFPNESQRLVSMIVDLNPKELDVDEFLYSSKTLKNVWTSPTEEDKKPVFWVPQKDGEYLVVYTGWDENIPIYIGEYTIIAENDIGGPWYTAPIVGDLNGNADSFGNFNWNSDEVLNNLYEPLRINNPNYITRNNIGKEQSGLYDMYSYVFEPENYEQTVFLTAGAHANEEEGYFALANFMQQVVNEDGSNKELKYLRENVRFVIIPIINVWGTYQSPIRVNSTGTDLNRDYEDFSQQETKNVVAVIEKYKDEITFAIDFHTTPVDSGIDLYFNYQLPAANFEINNRTVNHLYHKLIEKKYLKELRKIYVPTDGGTTLGAAVQGIYTNEKYLPNYIWNNYKIPAMTIEHLNSNTMPAKYSSGSMTLAVEEYGNFIIQNALFYDK